MPGPVENRTTSTGEVLEQDAARRLGAKLCIVCGEEIDQELPPLPGPACSYRCLRQDWETWRARRGSG